MSPSRAQKGDSLPLGSGSGHPVLPSLTPGSLTPGPPSARSRAAVHRPGPGCPLWGQGDGSTRWPHRSGVQGAQGSGAAGHIEAGAP